MNGRAWVVSTFDELIAAFNAGEKNIILTQTIIVPSDAGVINGGGALIRMLANGGDSVMVWGEAGGE